MAAVDQANQLNDFGSAEVDERVERRTDRPAGIEHIIDENDLAIIDGERDLGAPDEGLRADRMPHQIVAVQRDVERAGRHVVAGDLFERARDAPGYRHSARTDADERQVIDALVALDNLVCDAGEGSRDAIRIHDY